MQDTPGSNYHVGMTTGDSLDTRAAHHATNDPSCWSGNVCNNINNLHITTITTCMSYLCHSIPGPFKIPQFAQIFYVNIFNNLSVKM